MSRYYFTYFLCCCTARINSCFYSAYITANPDDAFAATVAAIACEGLAGQIAAARMGADDGVGSFRAYLLDAISSMDAAQLAAGAAIEEL